MTSHYVPEMDAFVAVCVPVLTTSNRYELFGRDHTCFKTIHTSDLRLVEAHGDLVDFEEAASLYQMVSPDCLETVAKRHKESRTKIH